MFSQTDSSILSERESGTSYADGHCHLIPDWFTMEDIEIIV